MVESRRNVVWPRSKSNAVVLISFQVRMSRKGGGRAGARGGAKRQVLLAGLEPGDVACSLRITRRLVKLQRQQLGAWRACNAVRVKLLSLPPPPQKTAYRWIQNTIACCCVEYVGRGNGRINGCEGRESWTVGSSFCGCSRCGVSFDGRGSNTCKEGPKRT
jgi:hypothetical protein